MHDNTATIADTRKLSKCYIELATEVASAYPLHLNIGYMTVAIRA